MQPKYTVTLTRDPSNTKETLGKLSVIKDDIHFQCDTLELPDLYNQQNISCIPKGSYLVKWTFSPSFLKYTYEVQNVPKRTGIRLHSANYFYQLKGCIALGSSLKDLDGDGQLDMVNSMIARDAFEIIMDREDFTLVIN